MIGCFDVVSNDDGVVVIVAVDDDDAPEDIDDRNDDINLPRKNKNEELVILSLVNSCSCFGLSFSDDTNDDEWERRSIDGEMRWRRSECDEV